MLPIDVYSTPALALVFHLVFSVLKYVVVAGVAYFIFYNWKYKSWIKYKNQLKMPSAKHLQHELFWSIMSRLIFGFMIVLISYNAGFTKLYFDVSEYGVPYLITTIIGLIIIHDSYFYWAHWMMHKPLFYKYMHKIHHHSTNPTPLASFSFHPSEAFIEVAIFPLLVFLLPLHPIALLSLMFFSMLFNVYGHSGFELMPRWWVKHPITKYINTSTHHNLHHKEFNYNFGLYFNHWDRLMGTLDPDYEQKFYAIKDRKETSIENPSVLERL